MCKQLVRHLRDGRGRLLELGRVTTTLKMIVPMADCDDCGINVMPVLLRKACLDGKPADADFVRWAAEEADKTERRLVYHANA